MGNDCGVYLSASDLQDLEEAARVLYSPFAHGGLDAWRSAVNERLCRIVHADLAMFFLTPELGSDAEHALVWSDELSSDQLGDFVRYALNDAGSERARAFALTLLTQRSLIGEDWDAYHADSAVNAFYLPNRLMDAIALMSWSREGKKRASIEIHSQQFGTPLFGNEGAARLRLLLPAFQASVAVLESACHVAADFTVLLDRLDQALALADSRGRLTHRSGALSRLVDEDPDAVQLASSLETLARSHAALFEARGFGHQHRVGGTAVVAGQTVMASIQTVTRRYRVFVVEAPESLTGGRLGFLLRVEPDFGARVSAVELHSHFALTAREVQVARLLGAGSSNQDIAASLHISPNTVRRHTEKVFVKLKARSRAEVAAILSGARQSTSTIE